MDAELDEVIDLSFVDVVGEAGVVEELFEDRVGFVGISFDVDKDCGQGVLETGVGF